MKRNACGRERIKNGRCREAATRRYHGSSCRASLHLASQGRHWPGQSDARGRRPGEWGHLFTHVHTGVALGRPGELPTPQAFPWAKRFCGMQLCLQDRWTHSQLRQLAGAARPAATNPLWLDGQCRKEPSCCEPHHVSRPTTRAPACLRSLNKPSLHCLSLATSC